MNGARKTLYYYFVTPKGGRVLRAVAAVTYKFAPTRGNGPGKAMLRRTMKTKRK